MKLQIIVLFVLTAVVLCSSSSEKIKGRRSYIDQLLRNQKDYSSRGRFFHKKGNQAPAQQPMIFIIEQSKPMSMPMPITPPFTAGMPFEEEVDFEGIIELEPIDDDAIRGIVDDENDFDDSEDEVDNYQTSKQNNMLKLKKINGKKQVYRISSPSKLNSDKNTPVSSEKGVQKLKMIRLNENNNANRNFDNIVLRRLVLQN